MTPPPSVHGGGQRLCRCCIILWQWRARGGHLCLQVLLLWYGLKWVGGGCRGRCRGEEGLDPLTAPDHWSIHRLITTDPWSVEPLLSPLAPQSALQQPLFGRGEMDGKNNDGWTCVLCLSHSLFLTVTKTGSPLHPAPKPPDSPLGHAEDYIWAAGDWGWGDWTTELQCTSCSNKKYIVILGSSSLSMEYHLNQSHDAAVWPSCDSFCFDQ